jgi:hypothetical protein
MDTTLLLIGFAIAVLMGAGLVSLLTTMRPKWSARRRQLTAASVLPAITIVATLLGILFISTADHGASAEMEELAIAALATIGGILTLLSLAGSLIGAVLAGRRRG